MTPCTVKKTLKIARQTGNDLLVQVKGNQPTLKQTLCLCIANTAPADSHTTTDLSRRNRHEQRIVRVWPFPVERFAPSSPWRLALTLIEVRRTAELFQTRTGDWKQREERSLYLCTRPMTAAQAAHAIRQHWAIENRLHYVRDVSLREDASRIRRKPTLLARFRSWALNLLRFNQENNISQALFKNALDFNRLLHYKALL